jgi:DNA-directed RNA polymerase specialized sigma24 family protein
MDDEPEDERSSEPPPSSSPPVELPPEIKNLDPAVLRDLLAAGRVLVIKKTRSKDIADQVISDTFYKLTTTRRWDPTKGPLLPYFLLSVKSELGHFFERQATERRRMLDDGLEREDLQGHMASAEQTVIEADGARARQALAAEVLRLLQEQIAHHPLMPRVLAAQMQGMKPAAIARHLELPERDIYGAIKLLKHHMNNIRAAQAGALQEEPWIN